MIATGAPHPPPAPPDRQPVSPAAPYWALSPTDALASTRSTERGLSSSEAVARLAEQGPNTLVSRQRNRGMRLLIAQFTSPIVLILIGATLLSFLLGDATDSLIILAIVVASGLLGFSQERSAGRAIDALLAQVRVTARVLRDGDETVVPSEEIVVGDVLVLLPGTAIAADCRMLSSEGLLVDESALTGESMPTSKSAASAAHDAPLSRRCSAVFLGTHVVSGQGTAVVVWTGRRTEFGALSESLGEEDVVTSFETGATRFGFLLVRAMVVLVTLVFVINMALHRPLIDALLFSLALAVGLTPQLLPAIVAVSLAKGARGMADEKVIVKRLDAIEDFGSMTVLCTDKTGTLTEGAISLDAALDLEGAASRSVLRLALLNATLQRGVPNSLDEAIVREHAGDLGASYLGEVPYDFKRRRLSVLVDDAGSRVLVTKGAFASVLAACSHAQVGDEVLDLAEVRASIQRRFEDLSARGLRVLGVATRDLSAASVAAAPDAPAGATLATSLTVADESDLVLRGLITFADPPKASAADAIADLAQLGVSVCMITGDNVLAARHAATAVGLPTERILSGEEIGRLTDDELTAALAEVAVFAEVEPVHKERIVRALRATGESVGFLGDGINDVAALHAADIGISVDTAVDVAKQTAAIVLLDKSLDVVADGIRLGRQTFANTLKYVRVTISANFGNVLSMAVASGFLPFLPLLPRQILLLNFLSDVPATTISTDSVDAEQTLRPVKWDIRSIRTFMIAFGIVSSVFDILTFVVLRIGFHAGPELFRSGWFVESMATELVALLVLRTSRPFFRSRPSKALIYSSLGALSVTVLLPFSPLAEPLGLVALPADLLLALAVLVCVYVAANEIAKLRFLKSPADEKLPG